MLPRKVLKQLLLGTFCMDKKPGQVRFLVPSLMMSLLPLIQEPARRGGEGKPRFLSI